MSAPRKRARRPKRQRPDTPRAQKKVETRQALVEAAMALFREEGLETPSLDAICARAGFTRGAFYVHFKDRDELVEAVMSETGRLLLGELLDVEDVGTVVSRFLALVQGGRYPLSKAGGVPPSQLWAACARSPRVRARYLALASESIQRLERTIDRGQTAGLVRRDVPAEDAAALLLLLVVGAQQLLELGLPMAPGRLAGAALKLLARG